MKRLILPLLLLSATYAKSQDFPVYKPIPIPGIKAPVTEKDQIETVEAYYYNTYTKSYSKIKLELIVTEMALRIKRYRKLADTYWTPASGTISKLNNWEAESKNFEFKGYIAGLGTIYF